MSELFHSLRRIPFWAYLLVVFSISVNIIYMVYRYQAAYSGETGEPVNGHWIIDFNTPGGPVDRAGIKVGDTLVTCNGYPVEEWVSGYHGTKAGDTLIFGILKNNREVGIQVITDSKMSVYPVFFWSVSILALLISIVGLFIIKRKPDDQSILLFFIYIQLFAITSSTRNVMFHEPMFIFVNLSYILSSCLLGPVLVHFHSLFPRPLLKSNQNKIFTGSFYFLGMIIFIYSTLSYYLNINPFSDTKWQFNLLDRLVFFWIILCFLIAMATVTIQFLKVKNTLIRNQMLIVFTGSLFGFLTPMVYGIFYDYLNSIWLERPYLNFIYNGIGSLFMICCILIAIFRYRIWDIEVIIRKALLYLGATAIITATYLFLIWLVNQYFTRETNLIRFAILAVSVILFLVLRDRLQHLIDLIFHRETYDSATVVSDFEAKLAGIYSFDELKQKIVQSINDIFHVKSFVFSLKKNGLIYEPACIYGTNIPLEGSAYGINRELEEKLQKAKVFAPEELNSKPPILEESSGELVVPLVSDGQPNGFFICGQKKSERIYSRQDIQVLQLLAQRVVSLIHTAGLYQKDLDRQLMLERERARISQDMHDDVGASLTRISILSELTKNRSETDAETRQWLEQISTTSRSVMEEMSQIVWALNPKNDTLEGLIVYIRRFATEYLEPSSIRCFFELPKTLPQTPLSVEARRNIYLVVREALHNVVKHSGATEVVITLTLLPPRRINDLTPQPPLLQGEGAKGERSFTLTIRDNGRGFEPDTSEFPGNGLVNMKKRMNDIGGEFEIESTLTEGTMISLVVPT